MRKIFTILLLALVMSLSVSGCRTLTVEVGTVNAGAGRNEDGNVSLPQSEDILTYDKDTDYMSLMIRYAATGDTDALEAAIIARNAKIADHGLNYEPVTLEYFLENYEQYAGFSLNVDYSAEMERCCVNGDVAGGREVASKRNLKIDRLGLSYAKVSFDDLYELSKIITAEAGSSWLPMEWKMMVGEVVLNRAASVEFPNTIYDVIHQKGQYSSANTSFFSCLKPFEDCVVAAWRLLNGERLINDERVVFQSGEWQGGGTYLELYDEYYGYTYLCYSNHPELYERRG